MLKKIFITLILMFIPISANALVANEARLDYNKGIDYYKLGQYEKAAQYFRSAVNVSPDFIDAYYNLGSIYEYLGQDKAALAVFEQIFIRQPDDYESVYRAANLAYKVGEYQKAQQFIDSIPKSSTQYKFAMDLSKKMKNSPASVKQVQPKYSTPSVTSHLYENIQGPTGIVSDALGNLYVACYSDNSILKITPDGKRIMHVKDSKINGPIGLAIDVLGNLYIANYSNNNVLKVSKNGVISVLVANVDKPYCLYLKDNLLYVSLQGSNSVLRYKINN